ncbi:hypothetical protein V7O66_03995 [Methanolobus sp. ZRKC3]
MESTCMLMVLSFISRMEDFSGNIWADASPDYPEKNIHTVVKES